MCDCSTCSQNVNIVGVCLVFGLLNESVFSACTCNGDYQVSPENTPSSINISCDFKEIPCILAMQLMEAGLNGMNGVNVVLPVIMARRPDTDPVLTPSRSTGAKTARVSV